MVYLTKKIKQHIATAKGQFLLKWNTFNLTCTVNYLMQAMHRLCLKTHNSIET